MEVLYEGIRLTPAEIVNTAIEEDVHIIGLSILSGSHLPLVKDIMDRLNRAGLERVPVIIGGIIPTQDEDKLLAAGVAAVYTPKDFQVNDIMENIIEVVDRTYEER